MPNSAYGTSSKDLFIFCGQLLGISIRTKGYYEVRFPPCFYKLLAGAPLTRIDLASIDHAEYWDDSENISATTLRRNMSKESFDANDGVGYFQVQNISGKLIELIPGGKRIKVTWEQLIEVSSIEREGGERLLFVCCLLLFVVVVSSSSSSSYALL